MIIVADLMKRLPNQQAIRQLFRRHIIEDLSDSTPRDLFKTMAGQLAPTSSVAEVGTRQSQPGIPTHSQWMFPQVARADYVMVDAFDGPDVDIVADLHALPSAWQNRFQAFIAQAVFEHLERPWIAAREVARVLSPGGFCYVATHQTFPLHGYPSDFFRFSKEALALIFRDAGLRVVAVAYEHRAMITVPAVIVPRKFFRRWNADWPSYVVVHLLAVKDATGSDR